MIYLPEEHQGVVPCGMALWAYLLYDTPDCDPVFGVLAADPGLSEQQVRAQFVDRWIRLGNLLPRLRSEVLYNRGDTVFWTKGPVVVHSPARARRGTLRAVAPNPTDAHLADEARRLFLTGAAEAEIALELSRTRQGKQALAMFLSSFGRLSGAAAVARALPPGTKIPIRSARGQTVDLLEETNRLLTALENGLRGALGLKPRARFQHEGVPAAPRPQLRLIPGGREGNPQLSPMTSAEAARLVAYLNSRLGAAGSRVRLRIESRPYTHLRRPLVSERIIMERHAKSVCSGKPPRSSHDIGVSVSDPVRLFAHLHGFCAGEDQGCTRVVNELYDWHSQEFRPSAPGSLRRRQLARSVTPNPRRLRNGLL